MRAKYLNKCKKVLKTILDSLKLVTRLKRRIEVIKNEIKASWRGHFLSYLQSQRALACRPAHSGPLHQILFRNGKQTGFSNLWGAKLLSMKLPRINTHTEKKKYIYKQSCFLSQRALVAALWLWADCANIVQKLFWLNFLNSKQVHKLKYCTKQFLFSHEFNALSM